jgi:DNA-binding NarL/FixJ family response regulator
MKHRGDSSVHIKVFIADSSYLACELMAKALVESRQGITVVGAATDSAAVRKGIGESSADVAIVSASLSDGCNIGFQVVRDVRVSHPRIRIILLVDSDARSIVIEAFRVRADGIFTRDGTFEMLCKCIQAVQQGQIWANSNQLRFLTEAVGNREPGQIKSATGANLLTKREEELVRWVAEGLTNADISRQLNLREHTVRNYLFRVFNKLGVSNRLELALYVLRQKEASDNPIPPPADVVAFDGDGATGGHLRLPSSAMADLASGPEVRPRTALTAQPSALGTRTGR